jgi:DNA-binding SARP family transcriptional activator
MTVGLRSVVEDARGQPSVGASRPAPRLSLLWSFELTCGGRRVTLPMSAQRLLAFLALHERPVRRAFVAGSLWMDSSEEHAAGSLRSVIWRIRGVPHPLIETTGSELALHGSVWVDLYETRRLAERVTAGTVDGDDLDPWSLVFHGDLLPQWYEEWLVVERERFRQLRLRTLESMSELLAASGRYADAMEAALAAVSAEPLRESAHRAVILVHLAEGNHAEAIRQCRMYRRLLRDELGAEPSPRIEQLVDRLRVRAS